MRIYIAGPMSGIEKFNYPAFHAAEGILTMFGHKVFSPTRICPEAEFADYAATVAINARYKENLRQAMYILGAADAVALLYGWENSRGANLEVQFALATGMKVFFHDPYRPMNDTLVELDSSYLYRVLLRFADEKAFRTDPRNAQNIGVG